MCIRGQTALGHQGAQARVAQLKRRNLLAMGPEVMSTWLVYPTETTHAALEVICFLAPQEIVVLPLHGMMADTVVTSFATASHTLLSLQMA